MTIMDYDLVRPLIWFVVLIAIYAALSRGLFKAVDPLRLRSVDLAADLLRSSEVSELDKRIILQKLDEFYSARRAWGLAVTAVLLLVTLPFSRDRSDPADLSKMSKQTHAKFSAYRTNWVLGTIGNSLGASLVFTLAGLLALAIVMSGEVLSSLLFNGHLHDGRSNGHGHVRT